MKVMEEVNMNEFPIVQECIDNGNGAYIKNLAQSVRKQLETRRYYKMKYSGKFSPYVTETDVYNEIELFLQVAPKMFKADMEKFANGEGQFSGTTI